MRGEHAAGKGDKNRLEGRSLKAYSDSKLWANLEAKKQEELKKKHDMEFSTEFNEPWISTTNQEFTLSAGKYLINNEPVEVDKEGNMKFTEREK